MEEIDTFAWNIKDIQIGIFSLNHVWKREVCWSSNRSILQQKDLVDKKQKTFTCFILDKKL